MLKSFLDNDLALNEIADVLDFERQSGVLELACWRCWHPGPAAAAVEWEVQDLDG